MAETGNREYYAQIVLAGRWSSGWNYAGFGGLNYHIMDVLSVQPPTEAPPAGRLLARIQEINPQGYMRPDTPRFRILEIIDQARTKPAPPTP